MELGTLIICQVALLAYHQITTSKTFTLLPRRPGQIVPNLEHMHLHVWTLVTAIVTAVYYSRL